MTVRAQEGVPAQIKKAAENLRAKATLGLELALQSAAGAWLSHHA